MAALLGYTNVNGLSILVNASGSVSGSLTGGATGPANAWVHIFKRTTDGVEHDTVHYQQFRYKRRVDTIGSHEYLTLYRQPNM